MLHDTWIRIGYIVKEALPHVHKEMDKNNIMDVKFAWAKYMVAWSRSAPGLYAGIKLAVKGEWHQQVVQCQSTR